MLTAARAERDALKEEMASVDALPVVALHPRIADDYRRQVTGLNEALTSNPETRMEVMPLIRSLIDRITIFPAPTGRGVRIDISGRIASMLALATGQPVLERPLGVSAERVKGIEPSS